MSENSHSNPPEGKPTLDRLLAAASPAMAEELDRIMQESRASLEVEFNVRLKKALLEQEVDFRAKAEDERRQAVEETEKAVRAGVAAKLEAQFKADLTSQLDELRTRLEDEARQAIDASKAEHEQRVERERESVRLGVTAEMEARFKGDLQTRLEQLRSSLEQEAREAEERWKKESSEAAGRWKEQDEELTRQVDRWRLLAEFSRRIGDASSQVEILARFLRAAEQFSVGVALYLNKPEGLELWKSCGEKAFPELISEETIDPEWHFSKIVVRDKTIAAVCALEVEDRESLLVLVDGLTKAIENFGLRIRFFGPQSSSESAEENDEDRYQEKIRSEARRLARMLVSEIKLGHPKEVQKGRVNSDLYNRLHKEIDSSRETYRRQVATTENGEDYFHEEVVKILADNDPERLGEGYPGPA